MKKVLVFFALFFLCNSAFAQSLTINNTNPCGVTITMWAVCADCNNANQCDIVSNSFYVPGSTSMPFPNPLFFLAQVGWTTTNFLSPNCLFTSNQFQWTDAQVCFDVCTCPGFQDYPWCAQVSAQPNACGINTNCLGGFAAASIPVSVHCVTGVTFTPAIGCFMSNVIINIF